MEFMKKVSYLVDSEYEEGVREVDRSLISVVEVVTKGKTFREEKTYARSTPHTDVKATDEKLVEKFRHNASRILIQDKIEKAVKSLLELETVEDISELMKQVTL